MSECLPPGFTHSAIDSIPSGLTDIALSCSFSPLLSALAVHIVGVNRSINGVLLRSVNGDSSSTSASKTLDCNDDNDYVEEDSNNDNDNDDDDDDDDNDNDNDNNEDDDDDDGDDDNNNDHL